MEQRLSLVTLGVADLERARRFYEDGLGWRRGNAHPEVVSAVQAAAAAGTSFGAPTEAEVQLAEEICARIPSAEMVRMTSSGTEASMSAVRLAPRPAATGS